MARAAGPHRRRPGAAHRVRIAHRCRPRRAGARTARRSRCGRRNARASLPLSFAQRRLWFLNRFDPPIRRLQHPGGRCAAGASGRRGAGRRHHRGRRPARDPADRLPAGGRRTGAAILCPSGRLAALPSSAPTDGPCRQPCSGDRPRLRPRAATCRFAPSSSSWPRTPCPAPSPCTTLPPTAGRLAPLARDLSTAYNALVSGGEAALAPLPVHTPTTRCGSARTGQRGHPGGHLPSSSTFWTRELRGARRGSAAAIRLRPRPAQGARRHRRRPSRLDHRRPEPAAAAQRAGPGHSASLFMVLQAALAALLTKSGAGDDIPLGTPGGRPHGHPAGRPGGLLRQHPGAAHQHVRQPHRRGACWRASGTPTCTPTPIRTRPSSGWSRNSTRPAPSTGTRSSR